MVGAAQAGGYSPIGAVLERAIPFYRQCLSHLSPEMDGFVQMLCNGFRQFQNAFANQL
jgi:hypothetical protein